MNDEEVIVVGAGAAGLATAIFAGRLGCRVRILDGAARPGAKILVSGGSRCNVTNAVTASPRSSTAGATSAAMTARCSRAANGMASHRVPAC